MCLSLRGTQKIPAGPRKVYKMYSLPEGESNLSFSMGNDGLLVIPPYRGGRVLIFKDEPIVSNRKKKKLTPGEKKTGDISRGIHVYLKEAQALELTKGKHARTVIVECEAKPEHFLGQELWNKAESFGCVEADRRAVYHQITPLRVFAVKERGYNVEPVVFPKK